MGDNERQNIDNQINTYKELLMNTDYMALKHADGALTDDEYAEAKAKRQGWRDEINRLQEQLAGDI